MIIEDTDKGSKKLIDEGCDQKTGVDTMVYNSDTM
jgi:hypothetical protein